MKLSRKVLLPRPPRPEGKPRPEGEGRPNRPEGQKPQGEKSAENNNPSTEA